MGNKASKKDVPEVNDLLKPFLYVLRSGRSKSLTTAESDVAKLIGLSKEAKNYRIAGSKTKLFSNRIIEARSIVASQGFVEIDVKGKTKITSQGMEELATFSEEFESGSEASTESSVEPRSGRQGITGALKTKLPKKIVGNKKENVEYCVSPSDNLSDKQKIVQSQNNDARSESEKGDTQSLNDSTAYTVDSASEDGLLLQKIKNASLKKKIVAGALVLGLIVGGASVSGGTNADPTRSIDSTSSSVQAEVEIQNAPLAFEVITDSASANIGAVVIKVEGDSDEGEHVDDYYRASPNELYSVEYGPGTYTFTLFDGEIEVGDKVYSATPIKVVFSGDKELIASLELVLDEKATAAKEAEKKAAEEAKKKEEEEKAKAEAEAKAKEEEEARRKAEEEARAKEEAEAAAKAEEEAKAQAEAEEAARAEEERTQAEAEAAAAAAVAAQTAQVHDYVLNTNSHKFHYPSCRSVGKMAEHNKQYYTGTREEVIEMGYDSCKNCNP